MDARARDRAGPCSLDTAGRPAVRIRGGRGRRRRTQQLRSERLHARRRLVPDRGGLEEKPYALASRRRSLAGWAIRGGVTPGRGAGDARPCARVGASRCGCSSAEGQPVKDAYPDGTRESTGVTRGHAGNGSGPTDASGARARSASPAGPARRWRRSPEKGTGREFGDASAAGATIASRGSSCRRSRRSSPEEVSPRATSFPRSRGIRRRRRGDCGSLVARRTTEAPRDDREGGASRGDRERYSSGPRTVGSTATPCR